MNPRTNDEVRTALDELLKSDGWLIVCELVEKRFGAVQQLADIDDGIKAIPPSEIGDFQGVIVPQIRAASKAAFGVLDLPKEHLAMVKAGTAAPSRMFDTFRRVPGRVR